MSNIQETAAAASEKQTANVAQDEQSKGFIDRLCFFRKDSKQYTDAIFLWWYIFFLVICIFAAYKLIFEFSELAQTFGRIIGILSPFIFGFIIAYCINIPVSFFERVLQPVVKKMNILKKLEKEDRDKKIARITRIISIVITCIATVFLLVFGLRGFIPMIYDNAVQLIKLMPRYIEQGLNLLKNIPYAEQLGINEMIVPLIEARPWTNFELNFGGGLRFAQGFFSGVFASLLTIISTIYFIFEYDRLKDFFKRIIGTLYSEKKRRTTLKYVQLVDGSFRKFLTCQSLDSLILATITTTQFFFLGSPYPFVLGLMLGVVNIIPYFGSIFGSMLAVFITFFSNGWETALLTAIILLITQQFDGYFINPRIMGSSFKLSPILVIIAITVGGALGGIVGMIFAIPVVNVLKTVMDEFLQTRERRLSQAIATT